MVLKQANRADVADLDADLVRGSHPRAPLVGVGVGPATIIAVGWTGGHRFGHLGIYHLVWYYKIHAEMAQYDRRRVVPVAGPMLVLLFLSWTFIAPLVSYYGAGKRIAATQRAAGMTVSCSPGLGVLLMLLFGAGIAYYQSELNKVAAQNQVDAGTQVPLYA